MSRLFAFLLGFACSISAVADPRASQAYGRLPLHFEANRGQTHQDVDFLARGPGYRLFLTGGEAVLVLSQTHPEVERKRRSRKPHHDAPARVKSVALRMNLVGAATKPLASGLGELPGRAHYFLGSDPAQWRTNVPTYAKVHYREVYPGIDLVYYGKQRQLEYDFVVKPGADPKRIVLGFKGADRVEIDAGGELVLHALGGAVRQHKPVIYQEIDGVRREIAGGYVLKSANRVGFHLAAYDTSRPLIIDPVLAYSTYLGGSGNDSGYAIAVDADGNAYVTGTTGSSNFPTTAGAIQPIYASGSDGDAFVTKLNPAGSSLVYSTYLGGNDTDRAWGLAVDSEGNAYLAGYTRSSNFPTTPGAFQTVFSGGFDPLCLCVASEAFVAKLDPSGSALVYSTYLGGTGADGSFGIALDSDRNAYVTGYTDSYDFPTTPGAFQTSGRDGFVTKLDPAGSSLVYSTYVRGSLGSGIAVDAAGNAYLTGYTTFNSGFPTTPGAFQTTYGGAMHDAFVMKLDPAGSSLVYSTYLGGRLDDVSDAIAIDAFGNAYVTGWTESTNFPATEGAFQTTFGGSGGTPFDAFVTKLNPSGSSLVYSTYLGGSSGDYGNDIAVDSAGNVYVTGFTGSINFPTTIGALQPDFRGAYDAFVTKLNPGGSRLVYSTYLGGNSEDRGEGIAVDAAGNIYVTGIAASGDFSTTAGALQPSSGGSNDIFIVKFTEETATPVPFSGMPVSLPGSFAAEDFDLGGEGVAYHDNVPGNAGGQYRPSEDVDIIDSSDPEGGNYVVNNFETGEWLAYTVNVQACAQYDVELRVASTFSNSAFHVEIDGVNVTGSVLVPNTGGWSTFHWVGRQGVALGAGRHILKIVADQQYFDLNSIRVTATPTIPASTPFSGTPIAIPGSFAAEDFDLGGEGIAYRDNVPGNAGGQYRPSEDVDIIVSSDPEGGGYAVNNFETGEWLAYTINVAASTRYDIDLRVSSAFTNSAFHVEIDGVNVTGSVLVPNTGGWSTFQWVGRQGVALGAGRHVLKIVADQQYFNLNSIKVTPTP